LFFCRLFPVLAVLLAAPPLPATQMIPLSLAELTARAELVLRGTVTSKTCLRDDAGRIYTRVELNVTEIWKGTLATNRFTLVHGGGVLGGQRAEVGGQADYQPGAEVVAFLVINPRGEGVSLGLSQGKFDLWSDAATGEKMARNLFHGGPPRGAAAARGISPAGGGGLTAAELKRRVQNTTR